jgi:hypothetical protein
LPVTANYSKHLLFPIASEARTIKSAAAHIDGCCNRFSNYEEVSNLYLKEFCLKDKIVWLLLRCCRAQRATHSLLKKNFLFSIFPRNVRVG